MNGCNIGWSESIEHAVRDAIKRHGEVVSKTEDDHTALRLGPWTLRQYSWNVWEQSGGAYTELEYVDPDPVCSQCADCSPLTARTIERTAANLPHMEPETAHILEDRIMREALGRVADGDPWSRPLAIAAHEMATARRTRWYA